MGGGKTGTTGGARAGRLESRAGQLLKGTRGIRQSILGQAEEGLTTGGVGAQIPMIQRALEGQKAETSNILKQFGETSSLAGTPFGERIRSQIGQTGALQQQQTISDMVNQAIGRGTDMTALQSGLAGQLFGGVGGMQQAMTGAQAQMKTQQAQNLQKFISLAAGQGK